MFCFEKNNVTILVNVFYAKKEKVYSAYVSKHNSDRGKQVNLFNNFKQRKTRTVRDLSYAIKLRRKTMALP